ncbi:unnamed protein product [Blepharisma stoltei]|uniref:Uncharacterized protein n=1 Tax=Blepharisma stoltei TaxID=1481888 RepID=A0AAU9JMT2_9CILI|nr:unnamed protein product [Blepharisma stoltei]
MIGNLLILILNFLGIFILHKPYMRSDKRKFFCVLDKITIGHSMPQCIFGIAMHSIGILLCLFQIGGYSYYPISLWTFIVFITSLYTYKRLKELCFECVSTFIILLLIISLTIIELPYLPYYTFLIYLLILTLSLCITAYSV